MIPGTTRTVNIDVIFLFFIVISKSLTVGNGIEIEILNIKQNKQSFRLSCKI